MYPKDQLLRKQKLKHNKQIKLALALFLPLLIFFGLAGKNLSQILETASAWATASPTATPTPVSNLSNPYPVTQEHALQHTNAQFVKISPLTYSIAASSPAAAATVATVTTPLPTDVTQSTYLQKAGVTCTGGSTAGAATLKGLNANQDIVLEVPPNFPLVVDFGGQVASAAYSPVSLSITSPTGATCTVFVQYWLAD
jgi:hypothetical protein